LKPSINYLLVGLFVLTGIALFAWLVVWLVGVGRIPAERPIDMVFRDSVQGLMEGSRVQFMGIDVGAVEGVRLVGADPPLVQVRARIRDDTPIGPGTRATVEAELITGIAEVRLYHAPDERAVYHGLNPGVEEVATRPDSLLALMHRLPELTEEAIDLLNRAQRLLSDDNLARVEQTLDSIDRVAGAVAERREQIDLMLSRAAEAAGSVRGSAAAFEDLIGDLRPQLADTARSARDVAEALRDWLERHEEPLDAFIEEGIGQAGEMLEQFQGALAELERLGRRLGEDPSRIVFPETQDAIELPP
jgi:phospholipid/cholesterol/gamma-HCH transport system substrate-binding protein